jgi:succinate dehydrogenase / fumarate reductase membrane anchor subunit
MVMVTSITNLGRSGVHDWVIQRVSAVIIALYVFFILGYLITHPGMGFMQWRALFDLNSVRIFSVLSIVSIMAHAWIGMWTIATDYIKPTGLRFLFQATCAIAMFAYLVWGIEILWGV